MNRLNPMVAEWSPSFLCKQEKYQSQESALDKAVVSVEAIEKNGKKMIQERQAKCKEDLVTQQHKSALALTLPKPEVPIFGGDPVEYSKFVKALYYLVQYTVGEVQELMRSCLAMNPEEGYSEDRKLLKQRCGQSYKIATTYVDKVTKGPAIKSEDSKGLQNFATLLTSCRNTLRSIGYSSKFENPDSRRTR